MKKKCKAKVCKTPVEIVATEKSGPGVFNGNGSFARVMSGELLEDHPEWTAEQVEEEVRRLWSLWVDNQKIPRLLQQEEAGEEAGEEDVPQVESFGFARTDGKTWFPASKKVEVVRAGRVQVVFLLTGEALFVPKEDWMPYTAEAALDLLKDKVANRGGFRAALKEMRELMRTAEATPGGSTSSLGMARNLGGQWSNQKLGVEKRFNAAAFKEKIYLRTDGKYACKNCPSLTLAYKSVASRHARLCGERPNVPREKSTFERHTCSADDCTARFASMRELNSHYSSAHPGRRPLKCPPCRKIFKNSDNHKRHMREKHSVGKKHSCEFCPFTTARYVEIGHHIKRSHKDEYDLLVAEAEEKEKEGGQENTEEAVMENVEGQENAEKGNTEQDSEQDEEDEGQDQEGVLGHLQNQIRSLKKRYDTLVPVELLILSNLYEMRKKARALGLGSSFSEEMNIVEGSRGRKRAAVPDSITEPVRQSPRLLATQAESITQHQEGLERQLEAELIGDIDESDEGEDAKNIVEGVIEEMMYLAVEKEADVMKGVGLKCTVCEKQFNRTWNLKVHIEAMHSLPDDQIECTRKYCTRQFSTMFDMVKHRRLCKFRCGGCGKEMRRDDRVQSHMRKCDG